MNLFAPHRQPDFIIGSHDNPQIHRWWLIPRNPIFNVYLHHIKRSDADLELHDHPWWNLSIILRGSYVEELPGKKYKYRPQGSWIFRGGKAAHRLHVFDGSPSTVTLFITGPKFRTWGFHCPKGWVPWNNYVEKRGNESVVGRGCGES